MWKRCRGQGMWSLRAPSERAALPAPPRVQQPRSSCPPFSVTLRVTHSDSLLFLDHARTGQCPHLASRLPTLSFLCLRLLAQTSAWVSPTSLLSLCSNVVISMRSFLTTVLKIAPHCPPLPLFPPPLLHFKNSTYHSQMYS